MGLESGDYIDDLVITNPVGSDDRSTADDHLRLLKKVVKQTFPELDAAVNVSTTEMNYVADVTSAIQAQFTGKEPAQTVASQGEMEAGTEAALRSISPLRVKQAIAALSSILQILQVGITNATGTTIIPVDNTVPLSSEGTSIASQAITPVSTSNKVLIRVSCLLGCEDNADRPTATLAVFRGTTCIGVTGVGFYANLAQTVNNIAAGVTLEILDEPATISEVTYSIRVGKNTPGSSWYVNRNINGFTWYNYGSVGDSSGLCLMEVKG